MKRPTYPLLIGALALCAAWVQATERKPIGESLQRHSGAAYMSPDLQAMQADASLNPGMLWVKQGADLWQTVPQGAGQAKATCASCHGDASGSMRGVAARYPAFDEQLKQPINLAQRINQCRVKNQQLAPFKLESPDVLALESFVAYQSRGMALAPPQDERLSAYVERGRQRFEQRMGQINLSCAQCHDERAGLRLGGNLIPQAHPTGYPLYRLEWQGLGSLQRRLRNCINGVRAQLYPMGAPELVELELFLAKRAQGMALESPGVRP